MSPTTENHLIELLANHARLQQQLIEAQQTIIQLQQKIDAMTPKNPPDDEVYWHLYSDGMLSQEAAQSDNLATLLKFQQWNIDFAKKHIKPYVSPKVYSECLNQMTRGLTERITELEARKIKSRMVQPDENNKNSVINMRKSNPKSKAVQLRFGV